MKAPPHNIQAEECILGSLLNNNATLDYITGTGLQAEHFFEPMHQAFFAEISRKISLGQLATPVTLKDSFPDIKVGEFTISQVLAGLQAQAVTIAQAPDYAKLIVTLATKRAILNTADALEHASDDSVAPDEAIRICYEELDSIRLGLFNTSLRGSGANLHDTIVPVVEHMDAIQTGQAINAGGILTGFAAMDKTCGGLRPGELIVLAGRPAQGKFLKMDADILTPLGWRKMGNLAVGDHVLTPDGRSVPIVGVFPQGKQRIFRITFYDGRSIEAGGPHLWEVHSKHWKQPRIIDTDEIARRLNLARYKKWMHVPLYSGEGIASIDLPIPPYTLGAWLGDGCANSAHITKLDEHIFERIARQDGFKIGKRVRRAMGRTVHGLIFGLRAVGLLECRAWEKSIPPIYLMASKEQRLELLRGLLDTDGTVEPAGYIRYSTSSPKLAADVEQLVRSLGGLCRTTTKIPHFTYLSEYKAGRKHFVLSIRYRTPHDLVTLPRKAARLPQNYQYASRLKLRLDKVEPAGEAECQCIMIDDPRGLYVADGYIVTHNSTVASSMARQLAQSKTLGVGFFSMEMAKLQMGLRFLTDEAHTYADPIDYNSLLRSHSLTDERRERIHLAKRSMDGLPIEFDYSTYLTIGELSAKARAMAAKLKRNHGVSMGVLFIDYLKFIKASQRYAGHRVYEIGEITQSLKSLARDLDISVILLAQLNREVEKTESKRPELSHLRDSGDIEADADSVWLLFRENYYLKAAKSSDLEKLKETSNKLEINVAKQRMGPTGWIEFYCHLGSGALRGLENRDTRPFNERDGDFF